MNGDFALFSNDFSHERKERKSLGCEYSNTQGGDGRFRFAASSVDDLDDLESTAQVAPNVVGSFEQQQQQQQYHQTKHLPEAPRSHPRLHPHPDNCHLFFRAVDAHVLKHLFATIAVYNRTMTINYNKDGILIDEMDPSMRTIVRAQLFRDRFGANAFHTSDEIPVTVNLGRLYKHMRSVKKKDTLEIFLDKSLELVIRTRQPSAQRHHETVMKVQTSQCQQTDHPSNCEQPVVVVASELQKMCKDIDLRSGQGVTITSLESGAVEFTSCELNGFTKTKQTLGNLSCSGFPHENQINSEGFRPFVQTYDPDQIRGLMKMTPLSTQVRIYMKSGNYICFSTDIGTYGVLDIYHRSSDAKSLEESSAE